MTIRDPIDGTNIRIFLVDTQEALEKLHNYLESTIEKQENINPGVPLVLSLDLEHSNLDCHTGLPWLCSIRVSGKGHIYVVDLQKIDNFHIMKDVIEACVIDGANLKNDLPWLRAKYGIRPRKVWDVVIMERLLTAGISRNGNDLKSLVYKYCNGIELSKENRSVFIKDSSTLEWILKTKQYPEWHPNDINYAACDVLFLGKIRADQLVKIKASGLGAVSALENRLVPVVADMEYTGIYVDEKMWMELVCAAEVERSILYDETCQLLAGPLTRLSMFPEATGSRYDINLNSDQEIMERFKALGHPISSTNAGILKRVAHPAAAKLIEYRSADTNVTRYGRSWIAKKNEKTGRIHTNFNQVEARSGRYSSNDPNVQNVPGNEYRYCFRASPGKKLIIADYSQIELRILAELSGDANMIKVFHSGLDLHLATACMMYNKTPEEVVALGLRPHGKTMNFAQIYGQGLEAMAKTLGIPVDEARDLQSLYFNQFPGIKRFLNNMARKPFNTGYAETMLGRKRWFPIPGRGEEISSDLQYIMTSVGKNHPIQGTSADMTKLAQVIMADSFLKYNLPAEQINVVHDETVTEVDDYLADDTAKLIEDCMLEAGRFFIKSVPVLVSVTIDDKWSKG